MPLLFRKNFKTPSRISFSKKEIKMRVPIDRMIFYQNLEIRGSITKEINNIKLSKKMNDILHS